MDNEKVEDRKCFNNKNVNDETSKRIPDCGVTLNTNGCCLICLNEGSSNWSNKNLSNVGQTIISSALHNLFEILNVSPEKLFIALDKPFTREKNGTEITKGSSNSKSYTNINGTLCTYCGDYLQSLSDLWLQLKKIQLQMDHRLEGIQERISFSSMDTNLMQNYSKRMTSDVKSLSQLPVLDKLRKQIQQKSSLVRFSPQLKVKLNKLNEALTTTSILQTQSLEPRVDSVPVLCPSSVHIKQENFEVDLNYEDAHDNDEFKDTFPTPLKFTEFPPFYHQEASLAPLESEVTPRLPSQTKRCSFNPQSGKWKCSACPLEFSLQDNASRHYRSSHLRLRYKCEICQKDNFSRHWNLKQHKKKCKGVWKTRLIKFTCKICKKRFTEKWACKAHMMECGVVGKIKSVKTVLPGNDFNFNTNNEVDIEPETDAPSSSSLLLLEYENVLEKNKSASSSTADSGGPPSPGAVVKEESFCNNSSTSAKVLIVKNSKTGTYQCYICKKTFTTPRRARAHQESMHFHKRYNCDNCGAVYSRKDHLNKHQKSCTGKKPYRPRALKC